MYKKTISEIGFAWKRFWAFASQMLAYGLDARIIKEEVSTRKAFLHRPVCFAVHFILIWMFRAVVSVCAARLREGVLQTSSSFLPFRATGISWDEEKKKKEKKKRPLTAWQLCWGLHKPIETKVRRRALGIKRGRSIFQINACRCDRMTSKTTTVAAAKVVMSSLKWFKIWE